MIHLTWYNTTNARNERKLRCSDKWTSIVGRDEFGNLSPSYIAICAQMDETIFDQNGTHTHIRWFARAIAAIYFYRKKGPQPKSYRLLASHVRHPHRCNNLSFRNSDPDCNQQTGFMLSRTRSTFVIEPWNSWREKLLSISQSKFHKF